MSLRIILGGGMYGRLALLLTTEDYATLSEEEFKSPSYPGPFNPPKEAPKPRSEQHSKYGENRITVCQAIERALLPVVVTVEPLYTTTATATATATATSTRLHLNHTSTHTSTECNQNANNHQDDAVFSNRLGSSSNVCYWFQA